MCLHKAAYLEYASGEETIAFVALHAVLQVVVAHTKRLPVVHHVLALEYRGTFRTLEAPHMPGPVQRQ